MATGTSQLTRALRRGTVRTTAVPPNGHVMKPLDDEVDGDQAEVDVMAELLGPGASKTGVTSASVVPPPQAGPQGNAPLPESAPASLPGAPNATNPTVPVVPVARSRVARYGAPSADDPLGPQFAPPAPAKNPQPSTEARPWSRFVDENSKPEAVSARQAMSAAKVLAPLVAAVSFNPGSNVSPKLLAQSLSTMLVNVRRVSIEIAEAWSARYGKDVPDWCVSQLMQGMAGVIAQRWEKEGRVDVDLMRDLMINLLNSDSPEVAEMIVEASDTAYVEAKSPEISASRVAVSTAGASWALYHWVVHERLSLSEAGDMPSRFFTYGLEASEIVSRMLTKCVAECRGLILNIDVPDLRVAHLQASIGRMANLMGAEYVTQTRQVMNWIAEAPDDEAFELRKAAAAQQLDTRILPHIYEWARVNFLRIEQGAHRALEGLNETSKYPGAGTDSSARPVSV